MEIIISAVLYQTADCSIKVFRKIGIFLIHLLSFFSGKWLGTPDLTQCQSYWLQKLRQQLDKQASIVHVANDLTHYTSSFRPLSPGDLLLLIDTIEVMTSRMKNDLGTIPTLDQRRAVITEVVQVCFFCCVAVLTIWRSYFKLHCQK